MQYIQYPFIPHFLEITYASLSPSKLFIQLCFIILQCLVLKLDSFYTSPHLLPPLNFSIIMPEIREVTSGRVERKREEKDEILQ